SACCARRWPSRAATWRRSGPRCSGPPPRPGPPRLGPVAGESSAREPWVHGPAVREDGRVTDDPTVRSTMPPASFGWTAYGTPLHDDGAVPGGRDGRLELADVGRLARRAARGLVGVARAEERETL